MKAYMEESSSEAIETENGVEVDSEAEIAWGIPSR